MAVTISEIASECRVSEQAVRAWCRRNHVAKDAKGSFAITESQEAAIYQHYLGTERNQVSQHTKTNCETCETSETVLISILQVELERKNEQIERLQKQIEQLTSSLENTTAALTASQALHAADKQSMMMIEDKKRMPFWKRRKNNP